MVDYAYHDLFNQRNIPKDMIIVDTGATVTPVSNQAPTITDATYIFTTEEIKSESFVLEESLCSENNLKFGLCEAAHVSVTVIDKPEYSNLKDEMFNIYIYFNGDSSTLFQIGQYKIDSDTHSNDRRFRDLEMFDMIYYLRDHDIAEWYYGYFEENPVSEIGDAIEELFDWLINTEQMPITFADEELINGDLTISKTIDSDTITFDFFMQGILEVNGCFGHINRQGEFEFKWLQTYDQPAVKDIIDDIRVPDMAYEDVFVWSIGFVDVYDRDNKRLFHIGSSSKKYPSIYNIVDGFVFADKDRNDADSKTALRRMWNQIKNLIYRQVEVETVGDLCVEVGDRLEVQYRTTNGEPIFFHTYALERRLTGIQSLRDTFSAKGERKQPKYVISNPNWHVGDSDLGTSGTGTGGVSTVDNVTSNNDFVEIIRNIGYRLLAEPSGVECVYSEGDGEIKFKWTDPDDIATSEPASATWAGTVVVRKEDTPPLHRWDGTLIVDSTTKDAYKNTYLVDNSISANKRYYYGIFPYDTKGDYRFTKVISVNTAEYVLAPDIISIVQGASSDWDGSEVAIMWSGDNNKLTVQISSSQYLFKLYTGNTVIYSWTSPVGTSVSDADKIHVAFLQDTTKQVAKPSFVYHTGTGVYSYNQETPSDSEMSAIYTWLHPSS